ncbi:hypothetical protein ALP03_05866 [Pseudomonas amygdali pv. tabaci]|uniref:Uncharacterized protein n=1 Tax=Pseudomonas amygdali pv. tabaci TaxID=322 RepID=A0A3M6GDR4_PSEAJ|nr:hypothetical protein ALP03_05866 [Pseudomonas amygdali pv. tabaci]
MLVGPIVIAGNRPGTYVGTCADLGIAQIGQVANLGTLAQVRILEFDKVTHMRFGAQHTARAKTCKRAGIAALAQNCAFDVAVGFDDDTLAQGAVFDDAVRADDHVVLDDYLPFEDHVDVDQHITADADFAAYIESRRVTQGHTTRHQPAGFAQLVMALQLGELFAIIGTLHFHCVVRLLCSNNQPIIDGHGYYVCEVILALGVVVRQPPQPVSETLGRHRENASVAFGDCLLCIVRILVLDNRADTILLVANNAAVAGRIVQSDSQQAQLLRIDEFEQTRKRLHFNQRHIAVKNQHGLSRKRRQRLSNSVACAQLFVLHHEIQVIGCQLFTNSIRAVSDHDVYSTWG